MTVSDLLLEARTQLQGVSESPDLDAAVLLTAVMGASRTALASFPERVVTDSAVGRFRTMVARRLTGEPVAYILGTKEFAGLTLRVNRHVLIPRPATELIVQSVLDAWPPEQAFRLLDVGTGSGAIAIAIAAQRPRAVITATDISRDAIAVAQDNAARLGVADWIDFRSGTLLEPIRSDEAYDVITANLPYLPSAVAVAERLRFEPRLALDGGPDGLVLIRQFILELRRGSAWHELLFELDPPQFDIITALVKEIWPDVTVERITDGRDPRVLVCRLP